MSLSEDLLWWNALGNDYESHAEEVKLDFATNLRAALTGLGLSGADLARRMERQPAFVSRLLRGDENCTIETMANAVFSLGQRIQIRVIPPSGSTQWSFYDLSVHRVPKPASDTQRRPTEPQLRDGMYAA